MEVRQRYVLSQIRKIQRAYRCHLLVQGFYNVDEDQLTQIHESMKEREAPEITVDNADAEYFN